MLATSFHCSRSSSFTQRNVCTSANYSRPVCVRPPEVRLALTRVIKIDIRYPSFTNKTNGANSFYYIPLELLKVDIRVQLEGPKVLLSPSDIMSAFEYLRMKLSPDCLSIYTRRVRYSGPLATMVMGPVVNAPSMLITHEVIYVLNQFEEWIRRELMYDRLIFHIWKHDVGYIIGGRIIPTNETKSDKWQDDDIHVDELNSTLSAAYSLAGGVE